LSAYGSPHARRVYDATHDLLRACMDVQNHAAAAVGAADGGNDIDAVDHWWKAAVALRELEGAAEAMKDRLRQATDAVQVPR
jgi:hypothetical protein